MTQRYSTAQLDRFKREAKILCRDQSMPHSHALDLIALREGFANWSLLAKHAAASSRDALAEVAPADGEPASVRHYLHGDQSEQDAAHYYCARCDYFEPANHFTDAQAHTLQHHAKRFLTEHDRWKELRSELAWRHRPDDAVNLLADGAFRARAAYEASRSPFHRWLLAQVDRDDPIGDLAVDVRSDELFPIRAKTLRTLKAYLDGKGDHVAAALDEAWLEFASQRHKA